MACGCLGVAVGCVKGTLLYIVQLVYFRSVAAWDKMSIDVYGDLDRMMPHLLFHIGERSAWLCQLSGHGRGTGA